MSRTDAKGWSLDPYCCGQCLVCNRYPEGSDFLGHSSWCYYGDNEEAKSFAWPWPFTRPVFFKGRVYGFTGAFSDDCTPDGWHYTGGTTIDGCGVHIPNEDTTGDTARLVAEAADSLWNFESEWQKRYGKKVDS